MMRKISPGNVLPVGLDLKDSVLAGQDDHILKRLSSKPSG